jgi:ssDNA thymidine ADP-ribosyltransferase, DarT
MVAPPAPPKLYHILHVDRLPSVVADGSLWCDSITIARAAPGTTIGMGSIKARRLVLPVHPHPGHFVGDYVPFYFCPRSIMLHVIHRANHPELEYRGGQDPIIHLEADLSEVVDWANANQRRWAFTLSNAGAVYAQFRARLDQLGDVNWPAVAARDFRSPEIKEGKQAEFLVQGSFPWDMVRRIGVRSQLVAQQVASALGGVVHRPPVEILADWYY